MAPWKRHGTVRRLTGEFEALELRDGDKARYLGKGVTKAVENINTVINDTICGMDASDIYALDAAMIAADGTKDKSKLGAKCHPCGINCSGKSGGDRTDIPLYRFCGNFRQQTSGSDDEYFKWRRACSQIWMCRSS